jgi:hypothetical protein
MEVINIVEKASCLVAGGFFVWFLDDEGLARAFDIIEIGLALRDLCSPWRIYARPEGFMLALKDLCSPWGIYARPVEFMLALRDLCSSWRIYARPGEFMLALRVLCSPKNFSLLDFMSGVEGDIVFLYLSLYMASSLKKIFV